MMQKIYRLMLQLLVFLVVLGFVAKGWSVNCTRIAIRLYYGAKSGWNKVFIIVDPNVDQLTTDLVVSAGYDVLDEPTSIAVLTPEECVLNRCKPDVLVAKDSSFVYSNALNYPLGKFDANVIQYISITNGGFDEKYALVSLLIWGERLYFASVKDSPNKGFAPLLVKRIALDEMMKKVALIEERMAEVRKRKDAREKKIEKMREEATRYHKISKEAFSGRIE